MTLLTLTGHDPAADRAALQALVDFQRASATTGLAAPSHSARRAGLAALQARAAAAAARPFGQRLEQAFERCFARLVDEVGAQPLVACHPQLGGSGAGPLTGDIGRLLRQQPLDEAAELDLGVRWWQLARAAGLPVEADFGECLRLMEWTWLLHALLLQQADAAALKVALRYDPLKPLLLLLEPLSGTAPQAGFTF